LKGKGVSPENSFPPLLSIKVPSLVGTKQILKDLRTYNIFLLIHVNIWRNVVQMCCILGSWRF